MWIAGAVVLAALGAIAGYLAGASGGADLERARAEGEASGVRAGREQGTRRRLEGGHRTVVPARAP